ncbi:MAG: hypothetical protein LBJ63_12040 [Prevotellaceae bacterium]|jgi:hypothetical protein|nr:hypothetical protein [Prevotellaceae bacterium]
MKKKQKEFGDMTPEEIKAFEKDTNSIVLFDDTDYTRGINVQKFRMEGYTEIALAILIDGMKKPLILMDEHVIALKDYLDKNF